MDILTAIVVSSCGFVLWFFLILVGSVPRSTAVSLHSCGIRTDAYNMRRAFVGNSSLSGHYMANHHDFFILPYSPAFVPKVVMVGPGL